MQSAIPHRSPWLLVPPPPLFVLCFVAGTQLDRLLALRVPEGAAPAARAIGACIAAAGILFPLSALAMFAWNRTTLVPHGSARTLVTSGPYRITRNPMYLGLTLVYVGLALTLDRLAALPLLALPLWALSTKTIPFEEATLERIFAEEYRAYSARVRRWL